MSFAQGDSGGPATHKKNGQHILIGVVSYTRVTPNPPYECGNVSVFCRVSYLREWIDLLIGHNAKFCPNGSEAEDDYSKTVT